MSLEYVGACRDPARARLVVRGSVPDRAFLAFWVDDGRVEAGMTVGVPHVVPALEALVRGSRSPDPARLADAAVPLAELAELAAA